jgi:hypothetical protein
MGRSWFHALLIYWFVEGRVDMIAILCNRIVSGEETDATGDVS